MQFLSFDEPVLTRYTWVDEYKRQELQWQLLMVPSSLDATGKAILAFRPSTLYRKTIEQPTCSEIVGDSNRPNFDSNNNNSTGQSYETLAYPADFTAN